MERDQDEERKMDLQVTLNRNQMSGRDLGTRMPFRIDEVVSNQERSRLDGSSSMSGVQNTE